MPSRLLEYIPEDPVKSRYEVFTNYRSSGGVCIFKITKMYSLAGALKTDFLIFQKFS